MLTKATHDVICRRGLPFYITMLTDGQAATLRQQDAIVRKSRSWVAQAVADVVAWVGVVSHMTANHGRHL